MKAVVLTALKGSITKWKKIVAETGVDDGTTNCPLCQMFFDRGCLGCPVSRKVGLSNCEGTPWVNWARIHNGAFPYTIENEEHEHFARAELGFLQALLPEKKKTVKKAKKRL